MTEDISNISDIPETDIADIADIDEESNIKSKKEQKDKASDVASNMASKRVNERISSELWNVIEQKLPSFSLNVLSALTQNTKQLLNGKNEETQIETTIKRVLTNSYYRQVRDQFVSLKLITRIIDPSEIDDSKSSNKSNPKDKKDKKSKQVISSADKIRITNTTNRIMSYSNELAKSFNMSSLTPQFGFRAEYMEFVGLTFCYMSMYMIKNIDTYKKEKNYSQTMALMVSMQRFLDSCHNYYGTDPINSNQRTIISQIFINDMKHCYDQLDKIFVFDGMTVCQKAPSLLIHSPLDDYVHITSVKPRDHQRELIQSVISNINTGFFTIYNPMINSGKTTMVVPLAIIASHYKKKLLCVCNIDAVRIQMANACYNSEIRFAICTLNQDNTVRITPHWSSTLDNVTVYICGPEVAYYILNDKVSEQKYGPISKRFILFHDEPTVGADVANSTPLKENVRVLMDAPECTIFSSATAPDMTKLTVLTNHLISKYPQLKLLKVYSPTVQIASEVRTESGDIVVPYIGCKNGQDILKVINKIADVPFIGRMLAPTVALHLYKLMINEKISNVPDIPKLFKKVQNMKADKIREIVIEMLVLLSKQSDNLVKKICSSSILDPVTETKTEKKNKIDDDLGFEWNSNDDDTKLDKSESPYKINYMNLGKGEIWDSMTLVADVNPYEFALNNFKSLLDELSKIGIKTASKLIDNYKKMTALWEKRTEAILKNLEVSENDKGRKEQELSENRPTIKIPEEMHIGSVEYVKKYVPINKKDQIYESRFPLNIESIINRKFEVNGKQTMTGADLNIPDEIMLLLFCGIGIYAPSHKLSDTNYTNIVLEYASEGKLAYVIADESICFGTNFPFGAVYITDRFSKAHSVYTIFQLLGRAGRVGKLPKAKGRVSQDCARDLIEFTINPDKFEIEAKNIQQMIQIIETEKKSMIEKEIKLLEEKIIPKASKQIQIQKTEQSKPKSKSKKEIKMSVQTKTIIEDEEQEEEIKSVQTSQPIKTITIKENVAKHEDDWMDMLDEEPINTNNTTTQPKSPKSPNTSSKKSPRIVPISSVMDNNDHSVELSFERKTNNNVNKSKPKSDSVKSWRRG